MEIPLKPGLSHITNGTGEENRGGIIWPQFSVEELIKKSLRVRLVLTPTSIL